MASNLLRVYFADDSIDLPPALPTMTMKYDEILAVFIILTLRFPALPSVTPATLLVMSVGTMTAMPVSNASGV
jgi:hypothetical protein